MWDASYSRAGTKDFGTESDSEAERWTLMLPYVCLSELKYKSTFPFL